MFGQCDFGYGVMIYANGEKYVGEFDNNKRDGQGVYFLSNGDKYVGTWKNDEYNGEGRLYKRYGLIKSGIWSNNRLIKSQANIARCLTGDCKNGFSIYLQNNGTKVIGTFQNGTAHGQVVVFYPNGAKYVGNFNNFQKRANMCERVHICSQLPNTNQTYSNM